MQRGDMTCSAATNQCSPQPSAICAHVIRSLRGGTWHLRLMCSNKSFFMGHIFVLLWLQTLCYCTSPDEQPWNTNKHLLLARTVAQSTRRYHAALKTASLSTNGWGPFSVESSTFLIHYVLSVHQHMKTSTEASARRHRPVELNNFLKSNSKGCSLRRLLQYSFLRHIILYLYWFCFCCLELKLILSFLSH